MEEIITQFSSIVNLPDAAAQYLAQHIQTRSFSKGERPLVAGQVSKEIFFIKKGLMKMYYLHEGVEHIGDFFLEGDFAQDMRSSLTQQPSRYYFECVEACEMLVIPQEPLQEAYARFPAVFERLGRLISEMNYVLLADRHWAGLVLSHEERYQQLLQEKPELLQRVPQYMIASYLGITPVGLSKIRKRLAERESGE